MGQQVIRNGDALHPKLPHGAVELRRFRTFPLSPPKGEVRPMSDIHPLVRLNRSAMRRLAAFGLVAPVSMVKAAGGIAASEAVNWSRNS
jgi:hypothetical protein